MDFFYQQGELRLIGEVRRPTLVPMEQIAPLKHHRAALRHAINHSGVDQADIANSLEIDPGEFSRMLNHRSKRPREMTIDKIPHFCRVTNSKAIVQWLAYQIGDELIPYRRETTEQAIARIEQENRALREQLLRAA